MNDLKRKGIDTFFNESDKFEHQFVELHSERGNAAARQPFISEIVTWLQECVGQGPFLPNGSPERRAFRSLLERWNSRLRSQGYFFENIDHLADFDPTAGTVLNVACPYPGLEPYNKNQSTSFFGRETLVTTSVEHLEQPGNQILMIIGASGSGKSSVAMAGILPQLLRHHQKTWLFGPTLSPGAHPLAALAKSVTEVIGHPERAPELERDLTAAPDKAFDQLAALCEGKPLMLLIDQFEELFTLCQDEAEKDAFSQVLCSLSSTTVGKSGFSCKILLTMRSDHYGRLESSKILKDLHTRLFGDEKKEDGKQVFRNRALTALGFKDIKQAIKKPADDVGLRFIPEKLIDELASQTAGLANGLPLLQFCLRRLWNNRSKNNAGEPLDMVTEADIKALPDVEKALGTVADRIYKEFLSEETLEKICDRLFLELIVIDENFEEPLRRRRNESEIKEVLKSLSVKPKPEDVTRVINAFVEEGLLRRFGDAANSQIEVAHEALLRRWSHVKSLIDNDKKRLHDVKDIGRQARDWANHDLSVDYLRLKGDPLQKAGQYVDENWLIEPETVAYVNTCREQEENERSKNALAKETELQMVEKTKTMRQVKAASAIIIVVLIFCLVIIKTKEMSKVAATASLISDGYYFMQADDLEKAKKQFLKADELADRQSVAAKLALGLIFLNENKYKDAKDHFEEVIFATEDNNAPDDSHKNSTLYTCYYNRGKSHRGLHEFAEANSDFLKAIEYQEKSNPKDKNRADYYFQLGLSYRDLVRIDNAAEAFSKAIEYLERSNTYNEKLIEYYYQLGISYLDAGNTKAAETAFNKGISSHREIEAANRDGLGQVFLRQNQFEEASKHFSQAIALAKEDDPGTVTFKINLVQANLNLKLYEKAERECREIIAVLDAKQDKKQEDLRTRTYTMLGNALLAQNKSKEAIEFYEKVMQSNTQDALVTLYLTDAYMKDGNNPKAKEYLDKFEALAKNDPNLQSPEAKHFFSQKIKALQKELDSSGQ